MKILHLLSQRPELTGSGVYVTRMISQAADAGHENALLAGVPEAHCCTIDGCRSYHFVRFGSDLPYDVVGMSDVMPYSSKRFCDLEPEGLAAYEACFEHALSKVIATWKPDIIHANHLWILTSLAKRSVKGIPVIAACHGSDLRQFHCNPHLRERVLQGCRHLDAVLALHRQQRDEIVSLYGLPEDRVHVVGAGYAAHVFRPKAQIDLEKVGTEENKRPSRKSTFIQGFYESFAGSRSVNENRYGAQQVSVGLGAEQLSARALSVQEAGEGIPSAIVARCQQTREWNKCQLTVAYAGKLADAKGVPWLLHAMPYVIATAEQRGVNVSLELCGSAPEAEREHIQPLVDRLGNAVIMHGNVSQEQLAAIFSRADVFVLPSFYEGLPLVLLEALACGCRLVSTRLPGVVEVFGAMPEAVIRLVDLPRMQGIDSPCHDDETDFVARLAKTLVAQLFEVGNVSAGQELLGQYTWQAVFRRVAAVYSAVLATR